MPLEITSSHLGSQPKVLSYLLWARQLGKRGDERALTSAALGRGTERKDTDLVVISTDKGWDQCFLVQGEPSWRKVGPE